MSKVEVRNVKELRANSRETMCFHATIVIDGKVEGEVSNDGGGGAHFYEPPMLGERLMAILGDDGKPYTGRLDARTHAMLTTETAINGLVAAVLNARDLRRKLTSRVVVENADGSIRETKRIPKDHLLTVARSFVTRPGIVRVLNLLPEDEAIAIMLAKAGG